MSFWFELIGVSLRTAHRLEQLDKQQRNDMSSTMTLEQARAEKIEAERQILKIITEFQERTGVSLAGVDAGCFAYREYGSEPQGRITSVALRAEL